MLAELRSRVHLAGCETGSYTGAPAKLASLAVG